VRLSCWNADEVRGRNLSWSTFSGGTVFVFVS